MNTEKYNRTLTISVAGKSGKIVGVVIIRNSKGFWQAIRGCGTIALAPDLETLEKYLDKIVIGKWKGFVDFNRWADVEPSIPGDKISAA